MASIFTRIIKGEIPSYKVAENENFVAILDAFPVQKGHTLIIPKREEDNIFDLSDSELSEMMIFAKSVAKTLEKAFNCRKVGVTVIGLEVPHAHIHLIPMNEEKDMSFQNKKLTLSKEEMEEILEKIKKFQ
ncbi:MAG: HIT family protein [Bacteroidetes bacterium]|nr:HIT family protein [Bacteroidota bacterium]